MANRIIIVEPAFSLVPRGDSKTQTLNYLRNFFDENPDDVLTVTVPITRKTLLEFCRQKRSGLGHYKGIPQQRLVR